MNTSLTFIAYQTNEILNQNECNLHTQLSIMPGMMKNVYNPNPGKIQGLQVQSLPWLHRKTLSRNWRKIKRSEKKEGEERKVGHPFIADAGVSQLNSLIVLMRMEIGITTLENCLVFTLYQPTSLIGICPRKIQMHTHTHNLYTSFIYNNNIQEIIQKLSTVGSINKWWCTDTMENDLAKPMNELTWMHHIYLCWKE